MKGLTFTGGVHPATFKSLACDKEVRGAFIPAKVLIPLSQHVGAPAEPQVKVGDIVKVGACIGKSGGYVSAPVHASLSGKVTKIAYSTTPNLPRVLSVTIESQPGDDQTFKTDARPKVCDLTKEALITIIRDAGIVGLGGAAFPTHVKLSVPAGKKIDTVLINGAECEPYLTCDHRLMVEKASGVLKGLVIALKVLDVKKAYIAIEDNKAESIASMKKALGEMEKEMGGLSVEVTPLKTKYPQGAEKQVIKAVLNRIVPAGGLPMDVGCVVQNVGTLFAIYEAVYFNKPLIERVITVTGDCVKEPVNICVRVGTVVRDLVDHLGGLVKKPRKIIMGGPMMGIAQYTLDVPVIKGTSGILFLSDEKVAIYKESVCIRCGNCLEVCPMKLVPTLLAQYVKKEWFDKAKELGVANCYECGACAYECAAKIPILDYIKYGKAKI